MIVSSLSTRRSCRTRYRVLVGISIQGTQVHRVVSKHLSLVAHVLFITPDRNHCRYHHQRDKNQTFGDHHYQISQFNLCSHFGRFSLSMVRPSWRTSALLTLLLSRSVIDAANLTLAVIDDDTLDLYLNLWAPKLVMDQTRHIKLETYQIPSQAIQSNQIDSYLSNMSHVNGFIIASRCHAANLLVSFLRTRYGRDRLITRVDWNSCPVHRPSQCLDLAVRTWISYWNRSFNPPSSATMECSDRHQPTNLRADGTNQAENAINGKTLRLATVEVTRQLAYIKPTKFTDALLSETTFCHLPAERYSFTYTVQIPSDNTYGSQGVDGSWNGMIGMILADQVDMGAGPFTVTEARQEVVDFTVAYYEETTAILIPPPMEDTKILACTKPFQVEVWIALLMVMILFPLILWIQFRLLSRSKKKTGPTSTGSDRCPNLFRQYLFVYAVITTQSVRIVPSFGHSPRFVAAIWSLSAVVIIYLYVGTLISFLSVPKLRPIIFRLEDLPNSKLQWGVRAGTALDMLFTESKEGIYRIIGDELLRHPELITATDDEGFQRVVNGTYAYIKEKSYLEFAIERDFIDTGQCRLSVAKQEFFKAYFAFALAKRSPLQPFFSRKILQMLESGLTEYWRKKYWPSKNKCNDLKGNGPVIRSLTLYDLQSAFLILFMGSVLSALAFIVERAICSRFR